ncbi:hypothetical protein OIU84_019802 [Salix udensis]|uniref:Uncharacterized protein n=1 Tax=Salix udensis TaxID=889485 RepID=A0AAD6L1J6_9ROSI|nr:hypothetical protein OIU84_019802 [Salix udensis]
MISPSYQSLALKITVTSRNHLLPRSFPEPKINLTQKANNTNKKAKKSLYTFISPFLFLFLLDARKMRWKWFFVYLALPPPLGCQQNALKMVFPPRQSPRIHH